MAHYDEVLSLLTGTGFTVHEGHVPDRPAFPYSVLWWPGVGKPSINSFDATSGRLDVIFRVTSVGENGESVRIIAGAINDALTDQRITVAGWTNYPIRHHSTDVPIQEDRQVALTDSDRHPLYTVVAYRVSAEKA